MMDYCDIFVHHRMASYAVYNVVYAFRLLVHCKLYIYCTCTIVLSKVMPRHVYNY